MALVLEKVNPQGLVVRQPVEVGRNRFVAEPGFKYRIVDDGLGASKPEAKARRIGDDLVVEDLPDQTVVEFDGFFTRCTPEQSCALSMEGLGGGAAEITPASQPVAAMTDGSFLMSAAPEASSITPMAAEGAGMGVKIGGLALVGVGLAAAGGGGGGGGGGDSTPVGVTQPLSVTSAALTNDATPQITGKASSNAPLAISISGPTITTVIYNITADADGNWLLDLGAVRPSSVATLPDTGLPQGDYTVTVRTIVNNAASEIASSIRIDTITDMPTIDAIANDGLVNAAEKTAGVAVAGSAEAGSTVTVTWGAASHTVTAGADGRWATSFSPAEVPGDGSTEVQASAVDALGNPPAVASRPVIVAAVNPGVLISNDSGGTTNKPVTFTFTFSEPVNGFSAEDITVRGGTAGTFTQVDGTHYTLVVTPPANVATGTLSVSVAAGAATNEIGNPTLASNVQTVTIDTAAPTLTISDNVSGTANGSVVFTFTFDEPVTGFTSGDISVVNGSKGAFTPASDGRSYTLEVTPTANSSGMITLNVTANAYSDAAGNTNTSATSHSQPFDTQPPTLAISHEASASTPGAYVFTFTFSEPVSGFELSDIGVSGGSAGALNADSSTVYLLTVTPASDASGTISVSVPTGAAFDAAGNTHAAESDSVAFNNVTPPTLAISDDVSGTANGPITFTFTFSKPVAGFDDGDVTVSNGTKGTFTRVDDTHYTLVVTPPAGSSGDVNVSVPANAFTGVGGTITNSAGESTTQAYDTAPPTLSITDDVTGTASGPVTFTFTFSETVSDFDFSDIAVTGGTATAANFSGSGGTYQFLVTPPENSTTPIDIGIAAGAAHDAAGNGIAAATASQDVDTIPVPLPTPAPTVTIDDTTPDAVTNNGTITFTFAFDQDVTGFDASDLTVNNGVLGTLSGNGSSYSIDVTPAPGLNGEDVTVSVNANGVTGTSTTGPDGTATHSQAVDNVAPAQTALNGSASAGSITLTLSDVLETGSNNAETVTSFTRTDSQNNIVPLTWDGTSQTTVDATVVTGEQYTYHVTIQDRAGNSTLLDSVSIAAI
ncbi:MAG: Ig-like domain-containing protein [Burkholderiaceae bacterium]